jgi:sugar/nucleoside kinase (ribokinase family)
MKTTDVVTICNALVDILVHVDDAVIQKNQLTKGIMHLTDGKSQQALIRQCSDKSFTTELGGSSLNCIRALALLGKRTSFAGMISDDEFGALIQTRLDELRIASHLSFDASPGAATGSCVVLITPDGERTMNTCLGSSSQYDSHIIPKDDLEDAKVFHFCGYQWDTEGQKRTIREAIAVAKKAGVKISFDLADPFVVERYRSEFLKLIEQDADIVFANQAEAHLLFQGGEPADHCRELAKMGCISNVKIGSKGALLASPEAPEVRAIAPYSTSVIDTTAAGDLFAAGFLYGYTSHEPLETCGRIGASLAADIITRIGAQMNTEQLIRALRRV